MQLIAQDGLSGQEEVPVEKQQKVGKRKQWKRPQAQLLLTAQGKEHRRKLKKEAAGQEH